MKQLDIVVPGMLGPFADALPEYILPSLKQTEFNLLNKVMARAELSFVDANNYFETQLHLINPQCELSLCQLSAEFDELNINDGFYYRADPVHFKAESDHALLMGSDLISPTLDEVSQLVDCFNAHFLEDGLSLCFTSESRWYLKSTRPLNLKFTPLDYALGRDIKHFMPADIGAGEDALWWRKILNEAQMLFFQHAVNERRESQGQLTINGLWIWDVNANPGQNEKSHVKQLFSDDVMSIALANKTDLDVQPSSCINNVEGSAVWICDSIYQAVCYGDIEAWLGSLTEFCNDEFQTAMSLLSSKKIDEVNIYPCDGRKFSVNRMSLLKFWKSAVALSKYINK